MNEPKDTKQSWQRKKILTPFRFSSPRATAWRGKSASSWEVLGSLFLKVHKVTKVLKVSKVIVINESGFVVKNTAPIQCTGSNYETSWVLIRKMPFCKLLRTKRRFCEPFF